MKKGMKRIIAEVDLELHTAVKLHCVRLGVSMTEWLARVVAELMKELEGE